MSPLEEEGRVFRQEMHQEGCLLGDHAGPCELRDGGAFQVNQTRQHGSREENKTEIDPLRGRMRQEIDFWLEGLRHRPQMYGGTLFGIETLWFTVIWFEALLLTPPPDVETLSDARMSAMTQVVNARRWSSCVGPSTHVEALQDLSEDEKVKLLVELLDKIRTAFFLKLGHPLIDAR